MSSLQKPSQGVLLCGHGSRDDAAMTESMILKRKLQQRLPSSITVAMGFLEFNSPDLTHSLQQLYEGRIRRVAMLPVMLLAGGHARHDIPAIGAEFALNHPDMKISYGSDLGADDRMCAIGVERVMTMVKDHSIPIDDTLLLVVGRGNLDEAINNQMRSIASIIADRCALPHLVCFAGLAHPTIPEGYEEASSHRRHIIILPYLLFAGLLAQRIADGLTKFREAHKTCHWYLSSWLGPHDKLCDILCERSLSLLNSEK